MTNPTANSRPPNIACSKSLLLLRQKASFPTFSRMRTSRETATVSNTEAVLNASMVATAYTTRY